MRGHDMKEREEKWEELCRRAATEQDPEKLLRLTSRIIELLEAKEKRLQRKIVKVASQKGNRVFQIAYDEMLLITRAQLLKSRGYEVTSVLGNEDAKRMLDTSQSYRLFIVGHAAPRETREQMVRWLKTNFPGTKVLALNPPYHSNLPGADYNVALNGPDEWLAAVADAAA